ncbi:hypothetical protein WJX74_007643 [Apatococcus lobatus]|uniref:BZIP domain-containing protein n=1 Tax=Apatococcus lobatus TaxID=904363 RepID=A0AAW1RL10_9CHLO
MKSVSAIPHGQADPESTASDTAGMFRIDSRHLPDLPPTFLEAAQQLIGGDYGAMGNSLPASPGDQKPNSEMFSAVSVSMVPDDFQGGTLSHAVAAAERASRQPSGDCQLPPPAMPPNSSQDQTAHRGSDSRDNVQGACTAGPNEEAAAAQAADDYLDFPPLPHDQHGLEKADPQAEDATPNTAQEETQEPDNQTSVMLRKPAGPSVRLEVLGKRPHLSGKLAAGVGMQQPAVADSHSFHASNSQVQDEGLMPGDQQEPHSMNGPSDRSRGQLGMYISPMPGKPLAGGNSLGQSWGSSSRIVETGRPKPPASDPPGPPATFAMSDWKLGRGPARHTFGDLTPLQALTEVPAADHRGSAAISSQQQSSVQGPWLPSASQPSGAGLSFQSSPQLLLGRGWPAADFTIPIPSTHPAPQDANPLPAGLSAHRPPAASVPGQDDAQQREMDMPRWTAMPGQRSAPASCAWAPGMVPQSLHLSMPPGACGVMASGLNVVMPSGASNLMPPAQFEALRVLLMQQARPRPGPCTPEAAALLACSGLPPSNEDADTGLRRSERTCKPAKRRSDLVDLPDSNEDEDQGASTPDEAPRKKKRAGRSIEPIGEGQEELTDEQQRLARRRWHNRESAKRSRSKRQSDAEDQAAQVRKAETRNEKLSDQMATLQWQCCNYSLQLHELQGKHQAATQQCQRLASELQDIRCRQQSSEDIMPLEH